jgi:hypothetical protein
MMHKLFLILALIKCCVGVDIVTQGAFLVNTTNGNRIHLKCVNWYGAHSNLFVVHGLESQSLTHLVSKILETKANCVRIPISDDMVNMNPPVHYTSIQAMSRQDCNTTETALGVMDCVVNMLHQHGLHVFFNSHCSWPAWVGGGQGSSIQGLWHYNKLSSNHTVYTWIKCLEILAKRYKVAGIDLRNEVHDQDGVTITWGESPDIKTDWLAAASLATHQLFKIDNSMLIFVGGLCWNLDLRAMMQNVGPMEAFNRQKLVYTTHIYSFSFWWNNDFLKLMTFTSLVMSFTSFLCGLTLYFNYFSYVKHKVLKYSSITECISTELNIWEVFIGSVVFWFLWLVLSLVFYVTSYINGCSTLSQDSRWLIITCSTFLVLCLIVNCWYSWNHNLLWRHTFWGLCLCWFGLFSLTVFFVSLYLLSSQSYDDFFNLWMLNDRPVPVWVGEIGDDVAKINKNHAWYKAWNFVFKKYNLDFAYWAFNGRKWDGYSWYDESFGLLNYDYTTFRNFQFLKDIFE